MSDQSTNQPHIDTQLPDDMARCESLLARRSLPQPRLKRDELLYRAGWAAAEVHGQPHSASDGSAGRGTAIRTALAWSALSAAVAASVAVAITVRLLPAGANLADPPTVVAEESASQAPPTVDRESKPERKRLVRSSPDRFQRGTWVVWNSPLLTMRDRALQQAWNERWSFENGPIRGSRVNDREVAVPKTSREMLQEFLPKPSVNETSIVGPRRSSPRSLWKSFRLGETT